MELGAKAKEEAARWEKSLTRALQFKRTKVIEAAAAKSKRQEDILALKDKIKKLEDEIQAIKGWCRLGFDCPLPLTSLRSRPRTQIKRVSQTRKKQSEGSDRKTGGQRPP